MKELHKENGYSNDQTNILESSKSTITPQQRFQHAQNPFPSFQSLPTEFQKIFSTCYEIKRTCSDISKLHGQDDPNVVKLASQINHLESLLFGMDSNSVQTNSLPSSSTSIYHQSSPAPPQTQSSSSTNFGNNGAATATVVNITNYQYSQQMSPALNAPLNPISDATQNQFAHATSAQAIPVGIHAPLPYGGYRQPTNPYTSINPPNAAVAAIVSMGMASSAPPTPPSNSYLVEKSEVNLDSDSDPESQNSPPGSKKRRNYGQPGFPLIQDKGRGRRQRAKAAPPLVGEDQLYCRACGETQTCEWRRGPDGYKSLCNACGIHYAKIVKKEETAAQEYKPKSVGLSMLLNND